MKIIDPLSVMQKEYHISTVLQHLASQENCDGEPYDQTVMAAEYIRELERKNQLMLKAVKLAYRKHTLRDDTVGWEELGDCLLDALCEAMGDDEFNIWLEAQP